jgi:uncharacterized Zn-binding protein involved in type VI secretion
MDTAGKRWLSAAGGSAAGLAAILVFSLSSFSGGGSTLASGGMPAATQVHLTQIAGQLAQSNGDQHPRWVYVATMSYDRAMDFAGGGDQAPVPGNPPVYLIVMKGDFTATGASVPSGASAPSGTYLSAIYDARNFRGYEVGVTNTEPPPVGPVTYLQTP